MNTQVKTAVKVAVAAVNVEALNELRIYAKDSRKAATMAESAAKHLVRAAIKARNLFKPTVEAFYSEIRKDVNGLATAIGAERTKDGEGFQIPGTIRTQVSQVQRAIDNKVDLGTADKPAKIGEIRKATVEAVAKAEAEEAARNPVILTGDDAIRATLLLTLEEAQGWIKGASGEALEQMRHATLQWSAYMAGIVAKAATTAKPEAKAADTTVMPDAAMAADGAADETGEQAAEAAHEEAAQAAPRKGRKGRQAA